MKTRVVAYDDQGGATAARFYWLMQYHGHEKTYILDGGYTKWKGLGYPVSGDKPPVIVPKTFVPNIQSHMLVDRDAVMARIGRSDIVLLDSREPRRYLGLEEPIAQAGPPDSRSGKRILEGQPFVRW